MFTKCFLLLSAATLLAAHRMPSVPQFEGRIYGGKDESIVNVPWQVSLQVDGHHICGGSILNEKIIVTAAHCVYSEGFAREGLTVKSGSTYHDKDGRVVKVAALKLHEKYSDVTITNDVAILLLSEPLNLNGKGARAIKLAAKTPANGTHSTVTGWGDTEHGETNILQSAGVDIVDRKQCRKAYAKKYEITENMICAAAPGRDSCQRDSGGPLVAKGKLVGIVSWGIGCARPEYPGVYADVSVLRDWIVNAAKNIVKE